MQRAMTSGVAAVLAGASFGQVGIISLGDLPGGVTISHATDVSADGSVVVGNSTVDSGDAAAFRWTRAGGMERLPGVPGGSFYSTSHVSASGEFVTGSYTRPGGGGALGYIWSESTGTVSVGDLPGGREDSRTAAVSDAGVAVGFSSVGFTSTGASLGRAFRWTQAGGIQPLPLPSPDDENSPSRAFDILADGRIFGVSASGRWLYSDDTGFEFLPIPNYFNTINSDGTFMIGNVPTPFDPIIQRAAYWTPDQGEVLLEPYADDTFYGAVAMSDNGSIIVGAQSDIGWLLWFDQGTPVLLKDYAAQIGIDLEGWTIRSILDISADGTTIVGTAQRDGWEPGRQEAFVLTIPSPSVLPMTGLGLLATRRRR